MNTSHTGHHQQMDIESLRRIAESASEGPWQVLPPNPASPIDNNWHVSDVADTCAIHCHGFMHATDAQAEANARFIAAFSPAIVIKMLDALTARGAPPILIGLPPTPAERLVIEIFRDRQFTLQQLHSTLIEHHKFSNSRVSQVHKSLSARRVMRRVSTENGFPVYAITTSLANDSKESKQ